MNMGTSQSEPMVPMLSFQETYYVAKSIEGLLVILATEFVLTSHNKQDPDSAPTPTSHVNRP